MLAYRKKKKKKNTAHACSREKKIQTSPYSFLARTCRKRGCITLIIHKCLSSLCSTNIIRELSPPPPPGPYSLDIDGPYSLGSWVRGGGGGDRIPYGPPDRNAYDTGYCNRKTARTVSAFNSPPISFSYTFLSFGVRIRQKISSYMNTAKCIEPMVGLGCQEVRVM